MKLPVMQELADIWSSWDPNRQKLYYIYGGYWKAKFVSPPGVPDPLFNSTNQAPVSTSNAVDLGVDDYMFLRPTQSEHVMLQFGDLLIINEGHISDQWPVFQETG
jgi:D-serine deaminase-like pyridoxal phosphate-dependent protein